MTTQETKCRFAEIIQYNCVPRTNRQGHPTTVYCVPIPRLFRLCPDRPAVEVTRLLDVDLTTGYIEIPRTLEQNLPRGKPWHEVTKNNDQSQDVV
ncbi:hypothetical protein FB45DRAFT_908098 [Roridomyces roridus]|uniref:Uncharacterized protein n=1 Tax=Roridomyces roridus TaxID=1738132 RepID=A0AAD7C295_9AGAR|nr:hypothetical protein FB45DRAFT_908098 [Roridomyces roridus]